MRKCELVEDAIGDDVGPLSASRVATRAARVTGAPACIGGLVFADHAEERAWARARAMFCDAFSTFLASQSKKFASPKRGNL